MVSQIKSDAFCWYKAGANCFESLFSKFGYSFGLYFSLAVRLWCCILQSFVRFLGFCDTADCDTASRKYFRPGDRICVVEYLERAE